MPELTKLDTYDYMILPGVVRVTLVGTNDPIMVDILSELDRSNGYLYVEGRYYLYYGYEVFTQRHPNAQTYMDLKVIQTQ